jgi:hypothetical protein
MTAITEAASIALWALVILVGLRVVEAVEAIQRRSR